MATFSVTTLVDENDVGASVATPGGTGLSLREALVLANGDPAADTITFDPALLNGTLFLTSGTELLISSDVTIDGDINGDRVADITISADSAVGADDAVSRVLHVNGGVAAPITVGLNGLVIRDGTTSLGGAGVRVDNDTLVVTNSTITANVSTVGGGGILNFGVTTLTNTTVSDNDAGPQTGGGIVNEGTLGIVNSTLSGNHAGYNGGAIFNYLGAVTIANSTLSGNYAGYVGGAVHNKHGTVTLTNTTLAGNAADYGGGIFNSDGVVTGTVTLVNSTVSGNYASGTGGGIQNQGSSGAVLVLTNSIVAGNDAGTGGDDLQNGAALTLSGGNIVGDTFTVDGASPQTGVALTDIFASVTNNPDTNVLSGTLADNGGPVQTIALKDAASNPALDAGGDTLAPATDARGFSRDDVAGAANNGANISDLGAFEVSQSLVVTTLADTVDATDGLLSLREALALANADPLTADTIDFDTALTGGSDPGVDDGHLLLTNGELTISTDVTINGDTNSDGKADIVIDADFDSRVFHATGGVSTLHALTITGGTVSGADNGGGIQVGATAALTITNSTVAGNYADAVGGGIANDGLLTLNNVLVAANIAGVGGGVYNSATGTANLTNTTIYGSYAYVAGGGMANLGTAALTNVTITGNQADGAVAGGIANDATGNLTLTNSIVAGNDAPSDADLSNLGTVTTNGTNLFSQAGVGDAGDTAGADITDIFRDTGTSFLGVDSGLLNDNGGPTPTVAIKTGGLAHNAAGTILPGDTTDADGNGNTAEPLPIDARGFARDVDGIDIGAVELQHGATYTVTTLDDQEFDGGDLAAETADGGGLSLREALALTNADPLSADTVRFDASLVGGTLTLVHGDLVVTGDTEITGDVPGGTDTDITIDAAGASRVFTIISGTSTLNGLTMTGGDPTGGFGLSYGYGGAVSIGAYLFSFAATAHVTISNSVVSNSYAYYGGGISVDTGSSLRMVNSIVTGNNADIGGGIAVNDGATLTAINTTISDNHAAGLFGYGGGFAVNSGGAATLINTTISGNTAYAGGGIYNSSHLTLINTTLANNSATYGGGLYNTPCGCATANILNSTITGNFAEDSGGGIAHYAGTLNLTNSIVAGNGAAYSGPDILALGAVSYGGKNVFSQAGIGSPGDIYEPDVANIFADVVTIDPTGTDGDEFLAGELALNNGVVQTVAIKGGGAAFNTGVNGALPLDTEDLDGDTNTGETLPVDARGFTRIFAGTVDIGAFELQSSPPTQVANNSLAVTEGDSTTISAGELAFTDAEQPDVTYTITTAVSAGTLFRSGTPLVLGSTFTQSDIDNLRIDYVHDGSEAPSVSFGFSVNDGVGGNVISGQTFTFTINPVNDAPVNTVPATQEAEANTNTAIAGISIVDVDAGSGTLTTTLSVTQGTLTVASAGGAAVSGSGTATVTLTGTLAAINTTLAAANNVLYKGAHDFFGTDTLTVATNDGGNTGIGGALTDTDSFTVHLNTAITGTPGNDSYDALPGNERIDALGGVDTITFNFRLVDARVTWQSNEVIVDGPSGSHTVLTGFEVFNFADGTVNNNDGSPLIDDLFYYATYHDVWTAHADADAHYNSVGWHEGRDPSAFFSTVIYLSANPDVKAGGGNPLTHFDVSGWKEGRVPSLTFDPAAYLAANPDVAAGGADPLRHYLESGYQEGRLPIAPTELIGANGFDYVYYLANNPDVAAAHVDPLQHFQTVGWKEGRNPNALFDVNGYLANYSDVAAANVNPLDHFNQFGWHEGRDPSVGFDTTSYLGAYPDVAIAGVNPLTHFLQFGIHEGRSPFADGVWG